MKRFFLAALAIFAFVTVDAQDEETTGFSNGDVFISGSFSFASQKDNNFDSTDNSFMIMPRVGFFVSDNIAVGAEIGFGTNKSESGNMTNSEFSTFAVGGFGRYYFTPANTFSLFGQLGVAYASQTFEFPPNPEAKVNTIGATLGVGFNYFIAKNFSFEVFAGALSYASAKPDADGAESINSFSFGGNWNDVTVGVNYRF